MVRTGSNVGDRETVREMAHDVGEIDYVKWECLRAWVADAEVPEVVTTHRDENVVVGIFGEDEEGGLPGCGSV